MPNNEGAPPVIAPDLPQPPAAERVAVPVNLTRTASPANQVTPHRLVTLSLIVEYLDGKQDEMNQLTPSDRTRISFHILNMIMFSDQTMLDTIEAQKRIFTGSAATILANWAFNLLKLLKKGIAGLMDVFVTVEKLILDESQNMVNRRSLVGLMMRRLFVQFDKMSFSEVSCLQIQLAQYITSGTYALKDILIDKERSERVCMDVSSDTEGTLESSEIRMQIGPGLMFSESNSQRCDPPAEAAGSQGMSKKQADLFIATQANLMQIAETQALSPIKLQREIESILKSNPGLPEAYFLSYLNNRRMGEVSLSVDSLHAASYHVVNAGFKQTIEEMNQSFRYADLNLGALHARFGHHSEARAAVREAITIGQEAKDHTCLQHCLGWLIRESPDGDSIALNQRSISRCEELNLPYLASLGMLHLASKTEELGDQPEYILDLLTRSSVLNCKCNILALQGNCALVRAKVWSTWGRPMMSQTLIQLLLRLNFVKEGASYQGEQTLIGLSNMALNLENEGYRDLTDTLLNVCQTLYPCPTSQYSKVWKITRHKILFSRHLAAGDWVKAESSLSTLTALQPGREVMLWQAELAFRQGDMEATRDTLTKIIDHYEKKEKSWPAESKEILVRSYILLSEIQVISHHTGGALEYLLKAQQVCEKHRLELLHCIVCLHVANNHLILGSSKRALKLVRQCLVFLLAHGSLRDRSRGLLLSAKCRIAASADLSEVERRSDLLEGATQVGQAKDGFLRLEDWDRVKDCLYLQARIYHSLGLTLERNMAAKQYKKFDELYPSTGPVLQLVLI